MPEVCNNACLVFIMWFTLALLSKVQIQISAFKVTSWLALSKLYNLSEPLKKKKQNFSIVASYLKHRTEEIFQGTVFHSSKDVIQRA